LVSLATSKPPHISCTSPVHKRWLTDFYITRLTDEHKRYLTLVVFLKPPAWEAIDGETIPATLRTLSTVLPAVAEIEHHGQALVVLEYEEWKTRVSKVQSKEQSDE